MAMRVTADESGLQRKKDGARAHSLSFSLRSRLLFIGIVNRIGKSVKIDGLPEPGGRPFRALVA
jgi:hypothetical protein